MSADQAAVVATIRGNERFVVVTHENPDGDALGSLVAMHELLSGLGKDSLIVSDRGLRYGVLAERFPADVARERTHP